MSEIQSPAMPARVPSKPSVLPALIHQEWKSCRGTIIGLSVLWIIGLWVLVIFHHPVWLMIIGLIYVLAVSSSQGGRDVIDGTEEFSFALPPGRGPLFISRLAPGLAFLTANGLLGGVAIAFNLPQRLWGIVFSSGLTDPFPPVEVSLWYALALFIPVAAHSITFSIAALIGTRAGVSFSWVLGFIGAGAIVLVGTYAENLLWSPSYGYLTVPGLLAVSVLAPFSAYQLYLRKEASGSSGAVARRNNSKGLLTVAAIIVFILVFFMLLSWWRFAAVRDSAERIQDEQRVRETTLTPQIEFEEN